MENVELDQNLGTQVEDDNSYVGSDLDLSEEDFQTEDTNDAYNSDEDTDNSQLNNPTNNAFAALRTSNKEYKSVIDDLDLIAKNAGLKDYKDFIERAKAQQANKVSKGTQDNDSSDENSALENRIAQLEQREISRLRENKEEKLVNSINEFAKTNGFSDKELDGILNNLESDGFTVDTMLDMTPNAVNRILNSYVDPTKAVLNRKSEIKSELPVSQSSKTSVTNINKLLDDKAKEMARRNNHNI